MDIKKLLSLIPKSTNKISYEKRMEIRKKVSDGWIKIKETLKENLLFDDIYCKLYYSNDYTSSEIEINLKKAHKALKNKNIHELQKIYDELFDTPKVRYLRWYKEEIVNTLKCDMIEIKDILSNIKTVEEADIVLAAVNSNDFLPSLEKGYAAAKKKKLQKKKIQHDTYERWLRRNRRILEKDLQLIGVGLKRSQKISQILYSI